MSRRRGLLGFGPHPMASDNVFSQHDSLNMRQLTKVAARPVEHKPCMSPLPTPKVLSLVSMPFVENVGKRTSPAGHRKAKSTADRIENVLCANLGVVLMRASRTVPFSMQSWLDTPVESSIAV